MNRLNRYSPTIFATVFFLLIDFAVMSSVRADEPLVLAMKIVPHRFQQEIMVSNGKEFHVLTTLEHGSILIEGKIKSVKDNVVSLTFKVTVRGSNRKGFANTTSRKIKLNINEFRSRGSGTRHLAISDIWIREGIDPVPVLIKQLSKPKLATSAISKLSKVGGGNKEVLAALKKAMTSDNAEIKEAASNAVKKLSKD